MEESLYETTILRQFAGLYLDRIPDETTISTSADCWKSMNRLAGFCSLSKAILATVVFCCAGHRGRCYDHPCAQLDEEQGLNLLLVL
jgi:hypothetical protein